MHSSGDRNREDTPWTDERSSALVAPWANSPAAATVLVRHLAKGTRHVGGLPQPWRTPAYVAAVAALERGELAEARAARGIGRPGRCGAPTGWWPARSGWSRPPPRRLARRASSTRRGGRGAAPGDERAAGDGGGLHGPDPGHRPRPARPRARRARRHPDRVPRHQGAPRRGRPGDRRRGRAPPGCCRPGCRCGPTPPWPGTSSSPPGWSRRCARPCCTRTATT